MTAAETTASVPSKYLENGRWPSIKSFNLESVGKNMAHDENEGNENSETLCWACKAPLRSGQKICLECQNWQNWKRHLNVSNTTLSLLVALIAVISSTFPTIIRYGTQDFKSFELISGEVTSSSIDERVAFRLKLINTGNVNAITPLLIFCYHAVEPNEESNYIMGVRPEENYEFISSERELLLPNEIKTVEYVSGDLYHFEADREIQSGALLCDFPYWDANDESVSLKFIALSDFVLQLDSEQFIFE